MTDKVVEKIVIAQQETYEDMRKRQKETKDAAEQAIGIRLLVKSVKAGGHYTNGWRSKYVPMKTLKKTETWQYFNKDTKTWEDIPVRNENVYVGKEDELTELE
jgi:hypothetical protein